MFKLLKLAIVAAALAAVWILVPIHGRTLQARWGAAPTALAFARAGWAELARALSAEPAAPAAKPKAGATVKGRTTERPDRPTEAHTEHDRQAVDQILAKHLRD
jgi:hypothetical protein